MPKPVWHSINREATTQPDDVQWADVVIGDALSGTERLSPYKYCEWTRQVDDTCGLDWYDHKNTQLQSLTTYPPDKTNEVETYTDAFCKTVTHRTRRGKANEIMARFLVYVE